MNHEFDASQDLFESQTVNNQSASQDLFASSDDEASQSVIEIDDEASQLVIEISDSDETQPPSPQNVVSRDIN